MTVNDWLTQNTTFTEAIMLDRNGNEVTIFIDDEPYKATVLAVEEKPGNHDYAILHTDWKGEQQMIKIYNIEWDTDGEVIEDLPTEVIIKNPTEEMCEAVGGFDDVLADYLSDEYGFCVFGFSADFC